MTYLDKLLLVRFSIGVALLMVGVLI